MRVVLAAVSAGAILLLCGGGCPGETETGPAGGDQAVNRDSGGKPADRGRKDGPAKSTDGKAPPRDQKIPPRDKPKPKPDTKPWPPPPNNPCCGKTLSGFWSGWIGDELKNFSSQSGYGTMSNNANGARWLVKGFDPGWQKIRVSFEVRFHHKDSFGHASGGQHLFQVNSRCGNFSCKWPDPRPLLRLDFSRPGPYGVGCTLYESKAAGVGAVERYLWFKTKTPIWKLGQWGKVTMEARISGSSVTATVDYGGGNKVTQTWKNVLVPKEGFRKVAVGNMDRRKPPHGTGQSYKIDFKNLSWKKL